MKKTKAKTKKINLRSEAAVRRVNELCMTEAPYPKINLYRDFEVNSLVLVLYYDEYDAFCEISLKDYVSKRKNLRGIGKATSKLVRSYRGKR
jgi:hypothetical protein